MDVKDIQMKTTEQLTVEQIINNEEQFQAYNKNDNNSKVSLTCLPDELWVLALSYLNAVDLFHTFHGLNQRFNNIINDCTRHIIFPKNVTDTWLDQYMPQFDSKIKTICLDQKSLQYVFDNQWSFPNLQWIDLQGSGWNLSLSIGEKPVLIILMCVSNFLQSIGISMKPFSTDERTFTIDEEDDYRKTLSCPYIKCLSATTCSVEQLIFICNRLPNLVYLKLSCMELGWYDIDHANNSDLIERKTRLVTLNITAYQFMHFHVLKQLINSCKTSLKNVTLKISSSRLIDGCRLEELFKSCEKLDKLIFLLKLENQKVDMDDCQRSFQSKWWLDTRRPPVYIQQPVIDGTIIISMPSKLSFSFTNNLSNWCFNKGNQNSSFVRFDNIQSIHFTNNVHQPISLEYLYSIDRIFTSRNQRLCFDYCDLILADILFDMLMDDDDGDDTSMEPVLPNVNHFIIGSSSKLDSTVLAVWILLQPNLKTLDISNLTTFNKTELAKELSDKINDHERLKASFDHIKELIILSSNNDMDKKEKEELFMAFQKVFTKAVIS